MKKLPRLIQKLIATGVIENPPEGVNCVDYAKMLETAQIKGWTPPTQEQLESVIDICEFEDYQSNKLVFIEHRKDIVIDNGITKLDIIKVAAGTYSNTEKTKMKNFVQANETEYERLKGLIEAATTASEIDNILSTADFQTEWNI